MKPVNALLLMMVAMSPFVPPQGSAEDAPGQSDDRRNDAGHSNRNHTKNTSALPEVPCLDVRGCPDLVVGGHYLLISGYQHNQNFKESSCAVQEGMITPGNRSILRFTVETPNYGDGDLIIGAPAAHPELFVWSECHRHYHFRQYADYRLWTREGFLRWDQLRNEDPKRNASETLERNPELRSHLVDGRKQGFCASDLFFSPVNRHGAVIPPDEKKYADCRSNQGISRGWADAYEGHLDGQWIDVTDLPIDVYVLEVEVNPDRVFKEKTYANNRDFTFVTVGIDQPKRGWDLHQIEGPDV